MNEKQLIQVADRIRGALLQLQKSRYLESARQMSLFVSRLADLTGHSRRLALAITRGWFAATERSCWAVNRQLGELPSSISKLQSLLDRRHKPVPEFSCIVEELRAVQAEFDDVGFDSEENTLCANTEPITLEDVHLGPFRIALHLDKLAELHSRMAYYVIAVDPHPAGKDEAVTHPHVSNEMLCEGDGAAAIRAALAEGRLSDFFLMVRGILTTYNPDSPYVPLKDWQGVSCYDCGYVMDDESVYYCTQCDNAVCDSCSRVCIECSEIVCRDCAGRCEVCEGSLCPNCGKAKCTECEATCCESCLTDGLCPDCKKEQEDEEQETDKTDKSSSTTEPQPIALGGRVAGGGAAAQGYDAAVQPDGLGQAPVRPGQIAQ